MTWGMGPMASFEALDQILKDKSASLLDVLKSDQLRAAFKRNHPTLLTYLSSHLLEVTDIALGTTEVPDINLQGAAMFCLSNDAPIFTNQISTNKTFLTRLSHFLKSENIEYNNMVVFYRIFKNCLEKSSGFMFINFPEKQEFVYNLVKYINFMPIFLLLKDIATNCYPSVNQFLDNCKAPLILLNSMNDNELHNTRVLEILTDFVMTAPALAKILANIDCSDKLLTHLNNPSNKVATRAFELLKQLVLLQDSGKVDSKIFSEVTNHLIEKVPDFVTFICKEGPYTSSKSSLTRLILALMPRIQNIPESILDLAVTLFKLIFDQQTQSFLHNDFLHLFQKLYDKTDIIAKTEMQKIIPEKAKEYHQINAVYWGQIMQIVGMVDKSSKKEEIEEWKVFITGFYKQYTETQDKYYGGPLPSSKDDSDSSYEYEYDYEEDEEDDSTTSEYSYEEDDDE